MRKLFAGNGNPPPKDNPRRAPVEPVDTDEGEMTPQDAGNGNPPPPDKP